MKAAVQMGAPPIGGSIADVWAPTICREPTHIDDETADMSGAPGLCCFHHEASR